MASKKTTKKDLISKQTQENELKFAYENSEGKIIYTPMYSEYNLLFFENMKSGLKMQSNFDKLSNTDYWEKYILNMAQFSAAKNRSEMKLLQKEVFDNEGNKRSFSEYKEKAQDIVDNFNTTWLRTEYDLTTHSAIMGEQWQSIVADKDLFPYMIYHTADSPCDICEPLDGMVFEIGSEADDLFPPNHYNCICEVETTDDDKGLASDDEVKERLNDVPENFRYNVGEDGLFPNEGNSYFDVLPNANDANYDMFGARPKGLTKLNTTIYNERAIKITLESWKDKNTNDIVFRNHEWLLNIRMSKKILEKLSKKARGFENIKKTIETPDEIFMSWENPNTQKKVII